MSNDYLPTIVDADRFAESGADLHGKLLLKDMPRLLPSLVDSEGDAQVDIKFDVDRQGIRHANGQVKASLQLQCQRCLEPLEYEITSDFSYGIVNTEQQVKSLPGHYDAVVTDDGNLNIQDMIEEELIINLPIVAMHDPDNCKVHLPIMVAGNSDALAKIEKENPFKVIESLKVKPKQK